MRIELSDPGHLDELYSALQEAECVPIRTGRDTLLVLHPLAVDEVEARTELLFFVRAWRARRPGVDVKLVG